MNTQNKKKRKNTEHDDKQQKINYKKHADCADEFSELGST